MSQATTTIAALATAPAPAGIAIVRVSGPKAKTALHAIFKGKTDPAADPRHLTYGDLIDFRDGSTIDYALAVYMPGPHSFTGEDIVEFQFHGSPAIVEKVLRSLLAFGAIPAEPGEFTKRAFLNGKMDLVQAEAIADLINATSEQALKVASEQLHGRFSGVVDAVGEPLRDALAELEALIDFPEEGIDPANYERIAAVVSAQNTRINSLLETYSYGCAIREGYRVLLCGRPNAGKSSILNLLLGKQRAIVSESSGTTRDLIEESAVLGGYRYVFCDSAGLTTTENEVEKIGIELAKERIPWADLVLLIVDASDTEQKWQETLTYLQGKAKKIWMVTNKIDLNPRAFGSFFCDSRICAQNFYISAKTRAGIDALVQALIDEVKSEAIDSADSSVIVTNERQRQCLISAQSALNQAFKALNDKLAPELISADLRNALSSLEEIVGKTYTEDILGRIFSKFCIGK